MAEEFVRLQKFMADNGVASRRKSEELIASGKVKVNGVVASIGDKVNPKKDKITVSGKRIAVDNELVYIMLHKPRGFITTMNDEHDRNCVAQLVSDVGKRIYPIGRLDRESEGLLLLTNDGELANAITHPKKHVPKTYRVTVRPSITESQITALSTGIEIDGRVTMPSEVHILEKQEGRVVISITIYEGRNRQIRKMCEALSLEVARLKRISVGPVKLGMLPQGKYRHLTDDEVRKLKIAAGIDNKSKRTK
jgi:23S rRNA pseudouridine2605 synthase